MAVCRKCNCEYNPTEAKEEFECDEWIAENDLQDYYHYYSHLCYHCAFGAITADYGQGIEDMSYHL